MWKGQSLSLGSTIKKALFKKQCMKHYLNEKFEDNHCISVKVVFAWKNQWPLIFILWLICSFSVSDSPLLTRTFKKKILYGQLEKFSPSIFLLITGPIFDKYSHKIPSLLFTGPSNYFWKNNYFMRNQVYPKILKF